MGHIYSMKSKFKQYRAHNYHIDGEMVVKRGIKYAQDNSELMKRLANL